MDVDLLRPGTVPLAPDTVLWFEFLLDPHLLRKHLSKAQPDPSPCELMVEFMSVVTEQNGIEARSVELDGSGSPTAAAPASPPPSYSRKQLALKILTLKVAAILRWNLDVFEKKLPPNIQQQLMQDLVFMASDGAFSIPPQNIPAELVQHASLRFALTLYHRWMLRFTVNAALNAKTTKIPFAHISISGDPNYNMNPSFEKIRGAEATRAHSIRFLEEELSRLDSEGAGGVRRRDRIKVPVMDSFIHLTEDSDEMKHNWDAGDTYMSRHELAMQIHYDLNYNYFFYGQYDSARTHILACKQSVDLLERETSLYGYEGSRETPWGHFNYASVAKEDIIGYIKALNLAQDVLGDEPSLIQRLQESISNHYTGIISVLQADNLHRQIPMVYRQVVELDIQGSASSGVFTVARDLLNRVSALNAVRYSVEGGLPSSHPDFISKFKTVGIKFVDILFWAFGPVLTSNGLTHLEWDRIRTFFLHLATSQPSFPADRVEEYLKKHVGEDAAIILKKIFHAEHLMCIIDDCGETDDENMELPAELLSEDWDTSDLDVKTVPDLEVGRLKRRLVEASTADDVRMCLVKLAMTAPSTPLWKLSPTWKPAPGLGNALIALPRGFLQDFGYIVSGTARARAEAGGARTALSLMSVLEAEARGQLGSSAEQTLYRLCRLLAWEVLLLQVGVLLAEWPHHRLPVSALANKCKAAIAAAASGDTLLPRKQVLEASWACMVNACEWEATAGTAPGAGGGVAEAAAALCAACLELQRAKQIRKFPRMLWDHVLLVFSNNNTTAVKRNASGHTTHSRDAPNASSEMRDTFNAFLRMLREPIAITVVCSLLARIYNILKDDSNLDLGIEYINLWPTSITNSNNYNAKHVMESLSGLVERGLRLYPYNVSWLRLSGDLHVASAHHGSALRQYLCSLVVSTAYLATPLAKRPQEEQGVYRRMVRCCAALDCPMQAAVLCQFTDDVDYALAFKSMSDRMESPGVADAMDGYYGCVWDATMLEFAVFAHGKRLEAQRRALAVRVAGALELNANNNEEIQREAANTRKAKTLRALTKQYVA